MCQTVIRSSQWPIAVFAVFAWLVIHGQPSHAQAVSGGNFSITIIGQNASFEELTIASVTNVPFGTTQSPPTSSTTYSGLSGQTLTVTSSETITPTLITNTITISVPTTFVPSGTQINGSPISTLLVDLGGYTYPGLGAQSLQFQNPVSSPTVTLQTVLSGVPVDLGVDNMSLSGDGMSLKAIGGITFNGNPSPLDDLAFWNDTSFTFTISYTPVPEPTGIALSGIVVVGGVGWWKKRRKACSCAEVTKKA